MKTLIRVGPFVLFLGLALLLWRPFDSDETLYQTSAGGAVPAGEIVTGFHRSQRVTPPEGATFPQGPAPCFGVLFATYVRSNDARLDVTWQQSGNRQSWRVDSADLVDNAYRIFCPDTGFDISQPFDLQVEGVDGQPGRSPTIWLLPDTRLGTALGPTGMDAPPRSLGLKVVARKSISTDAIASLAEGAFLIGWLCTLLIAAIVLLYRPVSPQPIDPR